MKNIYIFGSGGFAKEVAFLIDSINKDRLQYNLVGFIDVHPKINSIKIGSKNINVLDESKFFNTGQLPDACYSIGIGNPDVINKIQSRLGAKVEFPNLIHPKFEAFIEQIDMGIGNIITAGCVFTIDIKIGSFNIFNLNTTVGHDAIIGDGNVFNPGTQISGGVKIGNYNLIGTNSAILQSVIIDNYNTIGAGAMVNKDLGSSKVAVGVPAKVIKEK